MEPRESATDTCPDRTHAPGQTPSKESLPALLVSAPRGPGPRAQDSWTRHWGARGLEGLTHSPGVRPSGPRAQDSWTRHWGAQGLGSLTHSPDCRMMPLSVSLTSSLLSMAGFWEEGVSRRDRHPSQPRPGHGGGLEFPRLLKEQQKMTEIKPRASRQS